MNPGDILLFKGEDGISRLIQWGTGSKYSHVAICVSQEMNLAIEAMARLRWGLIGVFRALLCLLMLWGNINLPAHVFGEWIL